MGIRIVQVDAFAARPFAGNPAAVCVLERPADPRWMQDVAREMNLSETAFLVPRDGEFDLRWFTPAAEVALCGHATLASAKVPPAGLIEALGGGAAPLFVGKTRFDYLLELASEETIRALKPDFGALRALSVRGIIVTARGSSGEFDFVSRFFAPGVGVDEDPVTGSAHCGLTPYWAGRLGKQEMVAYQASPRGGIVRVRLQGDRVILAGQAVTVLRGELTTPPPA